MDDQAHQYILSHSHSNCGLVLKCIHSPLTLLLQPSLRPLSLHALLGVRLPQCKVHVCTCTVITLAKHKRPAYSAVDIPFEGMPTLLHIYIICLR